MGSHFCIFDHFKETSPNESTTEDVFDVVYVLDKELKRYWINYILSKCMVLEVEKNSFVVLRTIIMSGYFRLWEY